jgi:hypothetical protein
VKIALRSHTMQTTQFNETRFHIIVNIIQCFGPT